MGKMEESCESITGLNSSQVEALFNLFKEREKQARMSGKSLNVHSLQWVIDSGASHQMTPNLDALDNIHDLSELIHIAQPDGTIVTVKQARTAYLGGGLYLKEVLYTPNFKCNLISVQKLA